MISGNGHVGHERSSEGKQSGWKEELVPSGYPGAGDANGYTPAAGALGASPARAAEPIPPTKDEAGCSPGAVWLLRFHSIGTARARNTDGSREYWRNRPRADSHRVLAGTHEEPAHGLLDSAGSPPVGGESLLQ